MKVLNTADAEWKAKLIADAEAAAAEKALLDPPASARSTSSQKSSKSAASGSQSARGKVVPTEVNDPVDVAMFLGGQSVVMRLQAPGCIQAWKAAMGPFQADQWALKPTCLRALYKGDGDKSGLYGSPNEISAKKELGFFFNATNVNIDTRQKDKVRKSHMVSLDVIKQFVFPTSVQHARSTALLFVYGLYGPLNEYGKLCSGRGGKHEVNETELATMVKIIDDEDIIAVYVREHPENITNAEKMEVMKSADAALKDKPQITEPEFDKLFASLSRDEKGHVSFHEIQHVILRERQRRVAECRKMYPDLIHHDSRVIHNQKRCFVRPSKIDDKDVFLQNARLLAQRSYLITEVDNGNNPEVVQNVKLIRDEVREKYKKGEVHWDELCSLRGTNKPTYVKGTGTLVSTLRYTKK